MKNSPSIWRPNSQTPNPTVAEGAAVTLPVTETRGKAEQLLMPAFTLTWPSSPHTFDFFARPSGFEGKFTIKKEQVTQEILVPLPEDITQEEILDAWAKQGSKWQQLGASDDPVEIASVGDVERAFTAVRVIHVPKKGAIVWYILHLNNKQSFDICVFMEELDLAKFVKE